MNINIDSIMGKVEAWSKTEEGKRRINEVIERYRKEGRTKTAAGSDIPTVKRMEEAANKLIETLRSYACDLQESADSVKKHFDSLYPSAPIKRNDGKTVIYVYFRDDLSRDSLEDGDGGRTGEGAENIVAVLNNGARAEDFAYGWWDGHDPTGYALDRSGGDLKPGYAWVRSKKNREGLHFINKAVDEFNKKYGAQYHVTADAGDTYS